MDDRNSLKRARLGIGVSFDKKRGGKNYKTRIHFRSREVLLGRYKTCHEARMAYDQAAAMLAQYKDGVSTNYPPGSYKFYDPQVERKVLALLAATAAAVTTVAGKQQQVPCPGDMLTDWQLDAQQGTQQQSGCQQPDYITAAADIAADPHPTSFSSDNSSSCAEIMRQDSQTSHKQQAAFQTPEQQQDIPQVHSQQELWPPTRMRQLGKSRVGHHQWSGVQLPLVVCDAPLQLLLQAITDLPVRSAAQSAILCGECAA